MRYQHTLHVLYSKKLHLYSTGGILMGEFQMTIHSFQQAQNFVKLAMQQPFAVLVGNECQQINGKDLMGMFSLDYSRPVQVKVNCSEEEFLRFRQDAAQALL